MSMCLVETKLDSAGYVHGATCFELPQTSPYRSIRWMKAHNLIRRATRVNFFNIHGHT
jgi:hypothetical protein